MLLITPQAVLVKFYVGVGYDYTDARYVLMLNFLNCITRSTLFKVLINFQF